jgi:hypothetical protein
MPKRKRKAPFAQIRPPRFEISPTQWQLVEKAWRSAIPARARAEIYAATLDLVATAEFEASAESANDAVPILKSLLRDAGRISEAISWESAAPGARFARHLLLNHLKSDRLGSIDNYLKNDPRGIRRRGSKESLRPADPVQGFEEVLLAFRDACEQALSKTKDPRWSVDLGDAWEVWVQRLFAALIGTASLRKRGDLLAFIAVIGQLQAWVPDKCRGHTQSTDALAKAVRRAVAGARAQDVQPP